MVEGMLPSRFDALRRPLPGVLWLGARAFGGFVRVSWPKTLVRSSSF